MTKKEFIEKIKPLSIKAYQEFGILPSLIIAQAILESNWGKSAPENMLFGMKWTESCGYDFQELWTSEFISGKYIKVKAKFRKYDSWEDSIIDHSKLLLTKRYEPVIKSTNYLEATDQIKKCGYATSPKYTENLRNVIETHKLYVFDWWKSPDELLATNFKWGEFWSKSISGVKIEPPPDFYPSILSMANGLQLVRDLLNLPYSVFGKDKYKIKIVSGYRTKEWNKYVDGAENSYHMQGMAVDIKVGGISSCKLAVYIARYTKFNGFGIYNTWLHCDTRDEFTIYRG